MSLVYIVCAFRLAEAELVEEHLPHVSPHPVYSPRAASAGQPHMESRWLFTLSPELSGDFGRNVIHALLSDALATVAAPEPEEEFKVLGISVAHLPDDG